MQSSSGITCGNSGSRSGGASAYYQHQQFMNQMMANTMQGLMSNFWAGYQRGLELRRRRQAALNLNNAGIAYANKGNWTAAVSSFQNALGYSDDPVIRKNLAWAEDERSGRAEARRQAERERHQRINQIIGRLSDKLKAPATAPAATGAKNELDFLTPKGTAFFGQGGEAPPPVDLRDQTPDENGLAFIRPGGQDAAPAPRPSPGPEPDPAPGASRTGDLQVANNEGELQFLSPDAVIGDVPAAAPANASAHPDAASPMAAMLLDALAFGGRDWDKSRGYLRGLQKRYPKDENISDAIDELDRIRALTKTHDDRPPPPTPHVAELEEKGRQLIREGKFLDARGVLGRAYWEDPSQAEIGELLQATHLILVKEADAYKNQARDAVRRGSYAEAEMLLRAAGKRAPNDGAVPVRLSAIRTFDPHDEAMMRLVSGRESDLPIKPMMLVRDADTLTAARDYPAALQKLDEAARLAPDDRGLRAQYFKTRGLLDAEQKTFGQGYANLEQNHPYGIRSDNAPRQVSATTAQLIDHADKALLAGDIQTAIADAREAQMYEPGNAGLVDYINYLQGLMDFSSAR
ncbi:hypothetical protein L2D14_18155 [Thalassospiraceae bacterium LMO-JJ14]|nr:hypothetical protein L2D14_18155 [Thalassospiraceae bacterium LMO-JJ14]